MTGNPLASLRCSGRLVGIVDSGATSCHFEERFESRSPQLSLRPG